MSSNVVPLHKSNADPLADRMRAAYARTIRGRQEWIEGTLELAALLGEARDNYPDNRDLSTWLADNDLGEDKINPHDRAALISFGSNIDLARQILEETDRMSWQHIWRECKERFTLGHVTKSDPSPTSDANQPETSENPRQNDEPPVPENANSAPEKAPPKPEIVTRRVMQTSPLGKLPNADRVLGFVRNTGTRSTLAKIIGKNKKHPLWLMLNEAIDSGAFGPPSNASVEKPNLRLILPWVSLGYAQSFDLSRKQDLERVRAEVLPVALANPTIHKTPDQFPAAVLDAIHAKRQAHEEDMKARMLEAARKKMGGGKVQVGRYEVDEKEVIVFGERLWPRVNDSAFTYAELCVAIWSFQFIEPNLKTDWSPQSRAIQIRHIVKHMRPMLPDGFASAMLAVCNAYEISPDGQCDLPMRPLNYGNT